MKTFPIESWSLVSHSNHNQFSEGYKKKTLNKLLSNPQRFETWPLSGLGGGIAFKENSPIGNYTYEKEKNKHLFIILWNSISLQGTTQNINNFEKLISQIDTKGNRTWVCFMLFSAGKTKPCVWW